MKLRNYLARSIADFAALLVETALMAKVMDMPINWVSNTLMLIFAVQSIVSFVKLSYNSLNAAVIIRSRYYHRKSNKHIY